MLNPVMHCLNRTRKQLEPWRAHALQGFVVMVGSGLLLSGCAAHSATSTAGNPYEASVQMAQQRASLYAESPEQAHFPPPPLLEAGRRGIGELATFKTLQAEESIQNVLGVKPAPQTFINEDEVDSVEESGFSVDFGSASEGDGSVAEESTVGGQTTHTETTEQSSVYSKTVSTGSRTHRSYVMTTAVGVNQVSNTDPEWNRLLEKARTSPSKRAAFEESGVTRSSLSLPR